MNLSSLVEYLVKSLVKEPDTISVKQFEDDEFINIEVLVSSEDMGAVIGKGGKTAGAIRTIVQTSAYINNQKKVKINFDTFN